MKFFVFGDSFSANSQGWPSMLGLEIQNFSQNGIGEYKIFREVIQHLDFDRAIICHTSPWRIHTRIHPIHKNSQERPHNDFMLNDVEYYSQTNKEMKLVDDYLKKYYDPDYQLDVYKLILKELLSLKNTIHITFHDPEDTVGIANNYHNIWKQYPGDINHMSIKGNQMVAEEVKKLI